MEEGDECVIAGTGAMSERKPLKSTLTHENVRLRKREDTMRRIKKRRELELEQTRRGDGVDPSALPWTAHCKDILLLKWLMLMNTKHVIWDKNDTDTISMITYACSNEIALGQRHWAMTLMYFIVCAEDPANWKDEMCLKLGYHKIAILELQSGQNKDDQWLAISILTQLSRALIKYNGTEVFFAEVAPILGGFIHATLIENTNSVVHTTSCIWACDALYDCIRDETLFIPIMVLKPYAILLAEKCKAFLPHVGQCIKLQAAFWRTAAVIVNRIMKMAVASDNEKQCDAIETDLARDVAMILVNGAMTILKRTPDEESMRLSKRALDAISVCLTFRDDFHIKEFVVLDNKFLHILLSDIWTVCGAGQKLKQSGLERTYNSLFAITSTKNELILAEAENAHVIDHCIRVAICDAIVPKIRCIALRVVHNYYKMRTPKKTITSANMSQLLSELFDCVFNVDEYTGSGLRNLQEILSDTIVTYLAALYVDCRKDSQIIDQVLDWVCDMQEKAINLQTENVEINNRRELLNKIMWQASALFSEHSERLRELDCIDYSDYNEGFDGSDGVDEDEETN